ncbi:MAG: phosphoadenylyl-sulfate reductase [Opitutales bacterium]|nr:phosphoadenylyl-sulfate reductase [Opitutales bacterium]MCH8540968.1 phosphoadenylyl-sulfate reductase [Opitutales bacterium]
MTDEAIESVNAKLEDLEAKDRILWAHDHFPGKLVLSTSFGIQSAVMLHLVSQVAPETPVVFVDTGYLFPETYRFAQELQERLSLNLHKYVPRQTAAEQEALYGKLWEQGVQGLEKYNFINKVEPMNRALQELGAEAWLAGLRRSQASTRQDLEVVQRQNKMMKIHPIVDWSERQIYYYLKEHNLPYHPLWEKNFVSVGDWHSSKPLEAGESAESTRFNGMKRECGLHELSGQVDFQI